MNALNLLKTDHASVRTLFGSFERTGKTDLEKRNDLLAQIRREIQIHLKAEEEIFYPALKALNGEGRQLVSQALNDHKDINDLLTQISRLKLTAKNFDDRFEALIESVDHHVEEEEGKFSDLPRKIVRSKNLKISAGRSRNGSDSWTGNWRHEPCAQWFGKERTTSKSPRCQIPAL